MVCFDLLHFTSKLAVICKSFLEYCTQRVLLNVLYSFYEENNHCQFILFRELLKALPQFIPLELSCHLERQRSQNLDL